VAKDWCHAPGHLEDHSTLGQAGLAAKGLVAKDWCHAPGHLEGRSILGAAAGLAATGFAQGGHMVGKIVALHRGPKGGSKQGPCFPLHVVLIVCLGLFAYGGDASPPIVQLGFNIYF
jgi:hypothetical protein